MIRMIHSLSLRFSRSLMALCSLLAVPLATQAVTNPLDSADDLAPLTVAGYLNGTIGFSASGGTGTPATGGITMNDAAPNGTNEHTGIVFANSSFNAANNGVFSTSLMVNFKDFYSTSGVKDKGEIRIGFTTATTVNATKPKEFLNKTSPCFSVRLSGEHQHGTTDRKMETEVVSYTTVEDKPAALKKTATGAAYFQNWLRLTFTATKSGASTFSITVLVEDCGADGTATPTAIPALGSGPGTVTNATFAADTAVFAAFLIAPDKVSGTTTYVDNFTYDVTLPPPTAPVATAATNITASAFTANWAVGAGVPPASYVVEMTTAADNFTSGNYLTATGSTSTSGVSTAGTSQAFSNLSPLTSYVYRVRATNTAGPSADSNVMSATTIAGNSTPTLDPIPAQTPIRPTDGARTITLTGISAGGESGQTVSIGATSGNPAILPHPSLNYTSPNTTATLIYDPNGAGSGDVTITVTANDGQTENNTIVRTFVVPVRDPAPQLSFESGSDLIDLGSSPVNVSITRGSTGGIGNGGALVVQGTGGNVEKGAIVWRVQSYNGGTATDLHASIFYSPREIDDLATKDKGELTLGFAGSLNVNASKPAEFLRKTNPGLSLKLNVEHDPTDASKFRKLDAEPTSWDGFVEEKGPKVTLLNSPAVNSWLKVVFDAVKVGPETFSISFRVEDWGADGAAFVSVLMEGAPYLAENAAIANDPEIWSAFFLGPEKNGVAHHYLDQWETVVGENPPDVPVALSAVQVTSSSFLAKWQPGPGVFATGWKLDVSTAANNFAAGTLIDANGVGGQNDGIIIADGGTLQQRIANLSPATAYVYRVRAVNGYGTSANSNTITATTLANGQNSQPTLDPIANTPPLNINASQQTVALTGISAGGELDQIAEVTVASSNPALIPPSSLFVDYLDPAESGTLYFQPTEGESGTALITVTVDDRQAANYYITRTFTVTVTEPQTLIGFNDASAMSRLDVTSYNNAALGFGATSGLAGGGGAIFSKTGTLESTAVAFRPTAYDATVSPWLRASIFINVSELVNITSGKDKAELRFGFVGSNLPNASQPKDSINKTNPSLSMTFKLEHDFNKADKDRKVTVEMASFNGVTESKSGGGGGTLHVAATANWLQVNFYAVRGGQDQYYLVYDIQDWGPTGTAWQTQAFSGGPFLVTNAPFFTDPSVYAGFSLTTEPTSTRQVYFDSYEVIVNTTAADAPIPLAASNVRARQFTAEWAQALIGLNPTGYVLDVSTLANNFAAGTLLNANGGGGQNSGITLGTSATSQTITGLNPNENYLYRIRALRGSEPSAIIGKTYVTTLPTDLVHWRETSFPGQTGDPAISGNMADPDDDGVKNLLEYALGMNPLGGEGNLPACSISGAYLRLTFQRRVNAPDVVYYPESCGDLGDWQPNVTEIYASAPDANGLQTVIVEDNVPIAESGGQRFMRVRVDPLP